MLASYQDGDKRLIGQGDKPTKTHYVWVDENVEVGNLYSYLIADVSNQGVETRHIDFVQSVQVISSCKDVLGHNLSSNYPNPFNNITRFTFKLPEETNASIAIYNILGERIRILVDNEVKEAGEHFFEWNGTDDSGKPVSSGMYFCQVKACNFVGTNKMLLLK